MTESKLPMCRDPQAGPQLGDFDALFGLVDRPVDIGAIEDGYAMFTARLMSDKFRRDSGSN